MAGLEPGSSVSESDTMSTAPRRHFYHFQNPPNLVILPLKETSKVAKCLL
jgi:hypothetical protein